jgi:redox-sensitive bicupin YhaK (pirin superfamily)
MSCVELVIRPRAIDMGANFKVLRLLPKKSKRMVGPFIFWDHMGPVDLAEGEEMTVPAHPHIGLATITWLFSGQIMHRDSLGNEQPIRPGEVNWMTAGRGIAHSERAKGQLEPMTLDGIQLWLALPKEHEEVEPSFFHCKPQDLPQTKQNGVEYRLIAGRALDMESPVPVYSELFYMQAQLEPGGRINMPLQPKDEGGVYVVSGQVEVEGQFYGPSDMIIYKQGTSLVLNSSETSQVMIFGGSVFNEKRHIWWNFVSSNPKKIEQAKEDWSQGRFSPVINETERTPLPKI